MITQKQQVMFHLLSLLCVCLENLMSIIIVILVNS